MLDPEVFPEVSRQVFVMRFLKIFLLLAISVGFPSRGQSCCDEGWLQFRNNCYFFNHDLKGKADWKDAVKACQLLGGHLVDIRNEDERQFVKSHIRPGGIHDQYLIGMTDSASEGHWKYTDGSAVSFFKWRSTEPNGGRNENCMSLFSNSNIGLYNDAPCNLKLGRFICKKDETK